MTDQEITALAREYAEEIAEEVGVKFDPQDWGCSHCEIEARAVILFLLRRFCLVEKSKLEELEIARRAKEHGAVWLNQWEAAYLFPEIAK